MKKKQFGRLLALSLCMAMTVGCLSADVTQAKQNEPDEVITEAAQAAEGGD